MCLVGKESELKRQKEQRSQVEQDASQLSNRLAQAAKSCRV